VVTLPFREPENYGSKLGHSRSIALAQFLRNENRLKRDLPLIKQYDSVIQQYLDLGHMREVPPSYDSPSYYLPHHAVVKPESTTTKLRVVFNASSPYKANKGGPDILSSGMPGPSPVAPKSITKAKSETFLATQEDDKKLSVPTNNLKRSSQSPLTPKVRPQIQTKTVKSLATRSRKKLVTKLHLQPSRGSSRCPTV